MSEGSRSQTGNECVEKSLEDGDGTTKGTTSGVVNEGDAKSDDSVERKRMGI